MILCYKEFFVITTRRFTNLVSFGKCQVFAPPLSLLTRSNISCRLRSTRNLLENSLHKRRIVYSGYCHTRYLNDISLELNRHVGCGNQSIRHCSKVAEEKQEPEKKVGLFKKFKQMYKQYWYVLVPVHIITSTIWFGTFYYLVKSGVDVVDLLQKLRVGDTIIEKLQKGNGAMGYITIAGAMYKIATPARYAVTLGGTTLSIKFLKDWGYIKPIPPTEKIKEIIDEKKVILREKGENIKGFYKEKIKKKDEVE